MDALVFILVLFIILVGGGWVLGKGLGKMLFPNDRETYIDKSVHYHTTVINHNHEHKNISIIDDETKEKVIVYQKSIDLKNKKATN